MANQPIQVFVQERAQVLLVRFTGARDVYREAAKAAGVGMQHDLMRRYIELQTLLLTPVAPYWAEFVWLEVLSKPDTIQHALLPQIPITNLGLAAAQAYIRSTTSNITSAEGSQLERLAKGKAVSYAPKQPKKLTIFCAEAFPAWQNRYTTLVRDAFEKMGVVDIKPIISGIKKDDMKKAMPFVQGLKRRLNEGESSTDVFERKLPFLELVVLKEMVPGLKGTVQKCQAVEIVAIEKGGKSGSG